MRFLKRFKTVNKIEIDRDKYLKTSYSQCGEDLIIKHIFDGLNIQNPSFLDIGAHHPFNMSNTALFSINGSKGINIEPDPYLFKRFPEERKNDINLNVGIAEKDGEEDFYIISTPTLNTFSKETAESYIYEGAFKIVEIKKIKTKSIQSILHDYTNNIFPDLLSLDAEGLDEIILHSIDFETNCPIIICIETLSFSQNGNGEKNYSLIKYLESKGYLYYADTNINSIFVLKNKWNR